MLGAYHEYLTSHLSHLKKLTSHLSVILVPFFTNFSLHSSHLRADFPMFHFFTFKNGLLSLFTLVTVNMVSTPLCLMALYVLDRYVRLSVYNHSDRLTILKILSHAMLCNILLYRW
mgnify:CR=1 FL=1